MSQKNKSKRAKRRSSDGPMPSGGAGLIRFYQDASNGIKISPIATLVVAVLLIAFVIAGRAGFFDLFGG